MKYQEALRYLESLFSLEKTPNKEEKTEVYNLDFMNELMAELGNPEKSFRVVQVAGTNGKGSTSLFLQGIFTSHGLKTGLYSSPHFCSPRERISTNGDFISEEDFARIVLKLSELFKTRLGGIRTYFETITAAAFIYFNEQNVDVAVIEAGLGGRLDATNVCNAEVAVITSIGLDHMQTLGDTEEKILSEKLGIVKEHTKITMTATTSELTSFAQKFLKTKKIHLNTSLKTIADENFPENESLSIFDYPLKGQNTVFELSMAGKYLAANLSTALVASELFLEKSFDYKVAKSGVRKAFIPGRMQVVSRNPYIVFDGGHNAQAIENLLDTVEKAKEKFSSIHVLFCAMEDKDIGVLSIFQRHSLKMNFTEIEHFRAAKIDRFRDLNIKGANYFQDSLKAFEHIKSEANPDDLILVTGSIYLVSELLSKLGVCKVWQNKFTPISLDGRLTFDS